MIPLPREALFLAGKPFLEFGKSRGLKRSSLPDFCVGAHAAVERLPLLSRDTKRIRSYFPSVELISPQTQTV